MTEEPDRWTLAQLLAACGDVANARTVRFWITEGLVPAPSGGRGARARYGARHAARIAEIRRYQALGLSLANVALLLGAAPPSAPPSASPPADDAAERAASGAFWAQRPVVAAVRAPRVVPLAPGLSLHLDPGDDGRAIDDAAVASLVRASAPLLATYASLRAAPGASAPPVAPDPPTSSPTPQEG